MARTKRCAQRGGSRGGRGGFQGTSETTPAELNLKLEQLSGDDINAPGQRKQKLTLKQRQILQRKEKEEAAARRAAGGGGVGDQKTEPLSRVKVEDVQTVPLDEVKMDYVQAETLDEVKVGDAQAGTLDEVKMDYVQAETLDEVKVEDAQAGTLGGVKAGDMPPANRKRPLEDPADGKVGPSNTAGIRDTTASSTSPSKKQKLGTKAKQVDTAAVAASAIMEASASDASEPRRHKRLAQHPATRANDIYVSRKSNFKALIIYAQKLIDGNSFTTLTIHGLGAALQSAMRLALCLKEHNKGKISWVITTSTVQLVDDVEEEDVDEELKTEKRSNSAIHIELHKVTEASSAISPDSLPVTQ